MEFTEEAKRDNNKEAPQQGQDRAGPLNVAHSKELCWGQAGRHGSGSEKEKLVQADQTLDVQTRD